MNGAPGEGPPVFSATDYGHNFAILAELLEGVTKKAKLLADENKRLRIGLAKRIRNTTGKDITDIDVSVQAAAVQHIHDLEAYIAELVQKNEQLERRVEDLDMRLESREIEHKVLENEKTALIKNIEDLKKGAQDIMRDNDELNRINKELSDQVMILSEKNAQIEDKTLKSINKLMRTNKKQDNDNNNGNNNSNNNVNNYDNPENIIRSQMYPINAINNLPTGQGQYNITPDVRRNPREGEIKALESRLTLMSDKYSVLTRAKKDLEEQLGEMAARLATTESKLIRTNTMFEKVKNENDQLKNEIKMGDKMLDSTKHLLEEEQKRTSDLRNEMRELSKSKCINDDEIRSLAGKASSIVRKAQEQCNTIRKLENDNASLRSQIHEFSDPQTGKIQQLNSKISICQENISSLQNEKRELEQGKVQLSTKFDKLKMDFDVKNEKCKTLKRENKEKKEKISDLSLENGKLHTDLSSTKEELVQLSRKYKESETKHEAEMKNAKLQLETVYTTSENEKRNVNDALIRTLTELDNLRSLYTTEMEKRRAEIIKLKNACNKEREKNKKFKETLSAVTNRCRQLEEVLSIK